MQRSRLLVTVRAEHGLRQATGSLIMTLGKIMNPELTNEELDSMRSVYTAFGMAAHTAQLLEKELCALLLLPTLFEKVKPNVEGEFDRIRAFLDKQPLGELIKLLKPIATFGPGEEARLEEANRQRKFLIHHFFASRTEQFHSIEGRADMVKELNDIHALLHPIYTRFHEITFEAIQIMGKSKEEFELLLEAHSKQSKEKKEA